MKKSLITLRLFIAGLCMMALGACSFSKKDDEFAYGKDAILFDVKASKDLNTFNDQPHTLVVVVYQLADPNVFNQMIEEPDGVAKLLEAGAFDASVLSRRKFVVQPREQKKLHVDRAAGVRYLGVVAGYYSRRSQDFSRLMPMVINKKNSFFWNGKDKETADTIVDLNLGRSGIGGE